MPRCKLVSVSTPEAVQRAFEQLDAEVVGPALKKVGHGDSGFYLGRICGTAVEDLYGAAKVELLQSNFDWLHGRPKLQQLGNGRLRLVAGRSRAEGRSHREYNLLSDLLRGLSGKRIEPYVGDADARNAMCRDYADGWLFGHPASFDRNVSNFGSIQRVHDEHLIPTSAMVSYVAKVRASHSSVCTLFVVRGDDGSSELVTRHRIGIIQDTEVLGLEHSRLGESFSLESVQGHGRTRHVMVRGRPSMDIFVSASAGRVLTAISGADRCMDLDVLKVMFAMLPAGKIWVPPWHSPLVH